MNHAWKIIWLAIELLATVACAAEELPTPVEARIHTIAVPRVIHAERYIYAPSPVTGSAVFSAVYLGKSKGGDPSDRGGMRFKADANLPAELQAKPANYAGSSFDIGHLVEFAALSDDPKAGAATFNLSNAVPQDPTLNRGLWRTIEQRARELRDAPVVSGVLIVNVAIYDYRNHPPRFIGPQHVFVPTDLAKVALIFRDDEPAAMRAWIVPNVAPKNNDPDHYRVTVVDVQNKTQLDLFPDLDDELENRLENAK